MQRQGGFILMTTLIGIAFLATVGLMVVQVSLSHYLSTKRTFYNLQATGAAEAGAEKFLLEINKDKTYTPPGGETVFYNDSRGKATYQLTATTGNYINEKVLTATGRIYLPNRTLAYSTRKLKLVLRGINPFKYGLQTGIGDLWLYGNTTINGEVFTNKRIIVQDNSVDLRGTIKAAGYEPSTDCSIYGSGKISNSIINTARKVCLTTPSSTVTQYDSSVVPQPLPSVNKPAILEGITTNATCSSITSTPYQIKNAHYPNNSASGTSGGCDVTLSQNQVYTLMGDTHIRGNFTAKSNTIKISASLNRNIYVLVEGKIDISGNGSAVIPNSAGYTATFVSYDPTDSGGDKNNPNAITIAGNSLSLNSHFLDEVGSFGFSGRGTIGQIAAASIVLNGSGAMSFIEIDPTGTGDPSIWSVVYYQPLYN